MFHCCLLFVLLFSVVCLLRIAVCRSHVLAYVFACRGCLLAVTVVVVQYYILVVFVLSALILLKTEECVLSMHYSI